MKVIGIHKGECPQKTTSIKPVISPIQISFSSFLKEFHFINKEGSFIHKIIATFLQFINQFFHFPFFQNINIKDITNSVINSIIKSYNEIKQNKLNNYHEITNIITIIFQSFDLISHNIHLSEKQFLIYAFLHPNTSFESDHEYWKLLFNLIQKDKIVRNCIRNFHSKVILQIAFSLKDLIEYIYSEINDVYYSSIIDIINFISQFKRILID
jgi:hypothetical protein